MVVGYFVYQDVVDKTAVFVEQAEYCAWPMLQPRRIVGGDVIDELESLRTAHLDFAHVADIEQAHRPADGVVFVENAGILHRHVPAAEIYHLCPALPVSSIERGEPQGPGFTHEPRLYQP